MNMVVFRTAGGLQEVDMDRYPFIGGMFTTKEVMPADHGRQANIPFDDMGGTFLGRAVQSPEEFFAGLADD